MSAHVDFHPEDRNMPDRIAPRICRYGSARSADYFLVLDYGGAEVVFHSLALDQINALASDLLLAADVALRDRRPHLLDEPHPPALADGYVNVNQPS